MSDAESEDANSTNDAMMVTPVPEPARALTDVVRAFENADVAALNAALDAADTELLNRVPEVKYAEVIDFDPDYAVDDAFFGVNDQSFDDFEYEHGHIPLNLFACATYVLTAGRFDDHEWITRHTTDAWIAVYTALVNHPKVDVNAANKYEDHVEQSAQLNAEVKAIVAGMDPKDVTFQSDSSHILDDCLTPLDYCITNVQERLQRLPYDAVQTNASSRWVSVLRALLSSGRVDVKRDHRWYNNDAYMNDGTPLKAICNLRLMNVVHTVLDTYDVAVVNPPGLMKQIKEAATHVTSQLRTQEEVLYEGNYLEHLVAAFRKRLGKEIRKKLLTVIIPRVARAHILLARWSADARLAAYAPDGAGAKRARKSFDTTAAAAGW
jgi:hypothetical protein